MLVSLFQDVFAGLPLREPVRPGTYGLARELTLFLRRRADNCSNRQHPEERSIRTGEREHYCVRPGCGDPLDDGAHSAGCRQAAFRIEQPVEGIYDRLRIECRAVVKAYAFAQLDCPFGTRSVYAPLGGQAGHNIQVLIEPHQAFVHRIQNIHGQASRMVSRIHSER